MRIVVTGAVDTKTEKNLAAFKKISALVHFIPTIRIVRKRLSMKSMHALHSLSDYEYLLFTSTHAVSLFVEALRDQNIIWKDFKKLPTIVAIGSATAEACKDKGFKADLIPKEFGNTHVVRMFKKIAKGKRILFPRSAIGSMEIVKDLRAAGAQVLTIPLYTTKPVPLRTKAEKRNFDAIFQEDISYIVFMSGSSVESFSKNLSGSMLKRKILEIPVMCIGPSAAKTAHAANFKKVATSKISTTEGVIQTLQAHVIQDYTK